ncbi:MAG TPA: hypothetical protein VN660_02090 [Steroidobacteraceae bacterium]|nr:hypothetical protein [Steroidobacteraceae bacterium]
MSDSRRLSASDVEAARILNQANDVESFRALWKQKPCACHGADYRDAECERKYPDICPWRAADLAVLTGMYDKRDPSKGN